MNSPKRKPADSSFGHRLYDLRGGIWGLGFVDRTFEPMKDIRNFCIIAHIDHGKSTLADRMLEHTGSISERELQEQTLDDMDLERERGITIKSHAIQMKVAHEGTSYYLNLIDTPGHVDFSYEVSRSIASCEGALLVVDATQGIEAQTISNLYQAIEHDLEIIPVLNKMDLDSAMVEEVQEQIVDLIGCQPDEILPASGKTGMGVEEMVKALIERVPPPEGRPEAPLQAMIFDSVFDPYRGIMAYFRIFNGSIKKGDRVRFMNTETEAEADEIGYLGMKMLPVNSIGTGFVGYLISGIKNAKNVKVGDTITHAQSPAKDPLHGFEDVKPMVFAGIYPVDTEEYEELRNSLEKLHLNDASLVFEPEASHALGFGFRCGFLGMLHLEIVQERLDREYGMNVITTVPNVSYYAYDKSGNEIEVHNPSELPEPELLDRVEEPFIKAQIITKSEFVGPIMNLCIGKRGEVKDQVYLTQERVELTFEMPMAEIVFDFYDKLKSYSKGYASFDYETIGFHPSDLIKLDIFLNHERVDALSALVHRDNAYDLGRKMCAKLKDLIPRQQFEIPVQAGIGNKVIARETIKALKKDVTAKCYGGDVSRKRKLLEKQKEGKKKMRQVGKVDIPQEAFLAVLQLDEDND